MAVEIERYSYALRMRGGLLIREARLRAGLTQRELATRIGTKQPAIARWESGRQAPGLETIRRALRACGLDLELRVVVSDDSDESLFGRHLAMSPDQRLGQLEDLLAWERLAHKAVRVDDPA